MLPGMWRRWSVMGLVGLWVALGSAPAAAQPGLTPPEVAPEPDSEPAAERGLRGHDEDPTLGRAVFLPTAMTLPRGHVTFGLMQPLGPAGIVSGSAGLTDRLQLTGTFAAPYEDFGEAYLGASGKLGLVRAPAVHLAVQAGLGRFEGEEVISMLALAGSVCLAPGCGSLLSGYLGVAQVHEASAGPGPELVLAGVSLIARVSEHVRVVAELDHPAEADWDENLFLVGYGIRVTSGDASVEVVFVRPLDEDVTPAFGLPTLTATIRMR